MGEIAFSVACGAIVLLVVCTCALALLAVSYMAYVAIREFLFEPANLDEFRNTKENNYAD